MAVAMTSRAEARPERSRSAERSLDTVSNMQVQAVASRPGAIEHRPVRP